MPPEGDGEETVVGFKLGQFGGARIAVPLEELLQKLTAQFRSCEGCQDVSVLSVTRLDKPDADGCNWSSTVVLDTAGVQAEVYSLAYASVIGSARSTWNLK